MDRDDLLQPLFCQLSDEAAVQIDAFLKQLARCFENIHLSQIKRYRETMRTGSFPDCNQLDLFDPF